MMKIAILVGVSATIGAIGASAIVNTEWGKKTFDKPDKRLNKDTFKAGATAGIGIATFAVLRSFV